MLRPIGVYGGKQYTFYYMYETDQLQTKANSTKANSADTGGPLGTIQQLKFNHWYDSLVHFHFDADPTKGYLEW